MVKRLQVKKNLQKNQNSSKNSSNNSSEWFGTYFEETTTGTEIKPPFFVVGILNHFQLIVEYKVDFFFQHARCIISHLTIG